MTGPAALPAFDLLENLRMDEIRGRMQKVSDSGLPNGGGVGCGSCCF